MIIYSKQPRVIGSFDICCKEMMFVQDMPIAMPEEKVRIPEHLEVFHPLVSAVLESCQAPNGTYIYMSAKRMFVSPGSNYNRPGWHIDGYGTDDLNYVWCDSHPTEFCVDQHFYLSTDHTISMLQMEEQVSPLHIKTYPDRALLELDNTIVHRVAQVSEPGIRTFVKITVSKHRFNLEGNAHNYLFDYDWEMLPRKIQRNHPAGCRQ